MKKCNFDDFFEASSLQIFMVKNLVPKELTIAIEFQSDKRITLQIMRPWHCRYSGPFQCLRAEVHIPNIEIIYLYTASNSLAVII